MERVGNSFLTDLCIVTPVNDDAVLAANLLRSPAVAAGLPVKQMRGFRSAAIAYNAALDEISAEIVVFCHQDVYLPRSWLTKLEQAIRAVEKIDKNWAVLGLYGVKPDGAHVGNVWCSDANKVLNPPANMPAAVQSIDELLFVLRRSSGIRFDEKLPGFHLYGTDVVQTALAAGLGAYVVDAPVIHNTAGLSTLRGAYVRAFRYVARKWRNKLPIVTPCAPVTRYGLWLARVELSHFKNRLIHGVPPVVARPDAVELARRLGYE